MRRRMLTIAAGVAAAVLALGAWIAWPRGTTPVDADAAIEKLRAEAPRTAGEPTPATPSAGVYVYEAHGSETVRLGVLPEQQRDLPGELSGIVTRGEPGCFDIALDRFQEHTESSTLCTDGASVRLDGHRKTQSVGALRPSMAMECDPDVILDPATAHREITCSLGVSGGPAGVSVELPGTAVRGAPQTLVVGGEEVEAVPVAVELTATGSVQGIWKERIWFHPGSRLPLRIERALDLSGPVSFREDSTLRLVSLVPER